VKYWDWLAAAWPITAGLCTVSNDLQAKRNGSRIQLCEMAVSTVTEGLWLQPCAVAEAPSMTKAMASAALKAKRGMASAAGAENVLLENINQSTAA